MALAYLELPAGATERLLPCGITRCYLLPDTGKRAPRLPMTPSARHVLNRRDERKLS